MPCNTIRRLGKDDSSAAVIRLDQVSKILGISILAGVSPLAKKRSIEQEATEKTEKEFHVSLFSVIFCLMIWPFIQRSAIMHRLFEKASGLTKTIIGAAIEVHRTMGPGLLESIYEWCLLRELELRGVSAVNQKLVIVQYKQFKREETLRFDVLAEECLLVDAKAVERLLPIHKAQLLSYMKLLDVPLGLLINFHEIKLTDGVRRLILPGANR